MSSTTFSKLVSCRRSKLSPWVTLSVKKVLKVGKSDIAVYHSFQQSDYVSTLAVRADGLIPLVKQYRPAVEQITFELPGGLLDREAKPESIAKSELLEETGHPVNGKIHLLGCLYPDTGRLENRLWAYFAEVSQQQSQNWTPEIGVEAMWVSSSELHAMIMDGRFKHALHLAVIGLALTKGYFSWDK